MTAFLSTFSLSYAMTVEVVWKKIAISPLELSLNKVLRCGQTFRWKNVDNTWSFTTKDRIVLLRQDEQHIHYSWIMLEESEMKKSVSLSRLALETLSFVQDYFNLDVKLESLYQEWSAADKKYKKKTLPFETFTGIRILRQDPWETLISFICSSNNNVKRISKMCDSIVNEFGTYINEYGGIKYYSFPDAASLASSPDVETKLRELGFGYRAKYIYQTALKFVDDEEFPDITLEQLHDMRKQDYETAHEFLLQLTGVGPKVADCVCLMALDKHDIVPIDTHVYQIALRDYKFKGGKTMNKETYHQIRLFFKGIFGPYAGWAQSVLFTSDLSDLNNGINKVEINTEVQTEVKNEVKSKRISVEKRVLKVKDVNSVKRVKKAAKV